MTWLDCVFDHFSIVCSEW